MISQSTIDALNAIPLPQVFDRYGIDWCEGHNFKRPWGDTATGRTPSCRYYPNSNSFNDFGTHKGGGPINFVMLMDNLPFPEACKKLAGMFGIQGSFDFDPEAYARMRMTKAEARAEKERLYDIESRLALVGGIMEGSEDNALQLGPLMLSAALLDQDSFEDFVLGEPCLETLFEYAPQAREVIKRYLGRLTGTQDVYSIQRQVNPPCSCFNAPFSILPVLYPCGSTNMPLGFNDRDTTPQAQIKYRFDSIFSKRELIYGIDSAFIKASNSFPVILTEGIYDSLRLKSLGFASAVTPLTAHLTKMQAAYLVPLAKKGFILAFDGDNGGRSASEITQKSLDYYKCIYTDAGIASGEDPDSEGLRNPLGLVSKIHMAANRIAAIS